ncbi:hypothetical protein [Mycetocola miduiensis]|uniref:Dolichyl-phosphate-mannose-protein mannosyltransferase n=1 Tax=Mycetocola miduiensis TaxID=995034 RepID=A0A1I5DZT4_9MICO|nr:hypothetical protein [Mycetocola miduiensis]SFO04794.1 hypothetical protein SAMN05216219_3199 [Mycetocola miduiensis]
MSTTQQTMRAARLSSAASILRRIWVPLLLVFASFAMSWTVTGLHTDAMSPVDEWVYVDYLEKIPEQGIVHQGEEIGEEALERMACDGVKPYGPMGAPCGGNYDDVENFPFEGITSADAYTPMYFALTRIVGDAIHEVTGIDQLDGWRITGSLWLGATMILFYWLFRLWSVPRLLTLALGLTVIGSPFAWWTYTYVSTDAPSMAFGILILIAAMKLVRGQWSGWWLVAISAIAVLVKITNILGVCLAALYLLITWIAEWRRTDWAGVRTMRPDLASRSSLALPGFGVAALVGAGLAEGIWLVIRSLQSTGEVAEQGVSIPLTKIELISQVANFLPGTLTSNVNIAGSDAYAYDIPSFIIAPLSWICVAGVIGAFWSMWKREDRSNLILAVSLAAFFFAPMLAFVLYLATGSYFPLPPRYGAPILAGILLVAALSIRNRWATWIILAYSVVLIGTVFSLAPAMAP